MEGEKTIRPGEKLSSYPARIVAFIQILHRECSHRYGTLLFDRDCLRAVQIGPRFCPSIPTGRTVEAYVRMILRL